MEKAWEYEAKQNINSSKNTMKKLKFFVQTHWKKLLQWILTKQDFEDIGFSKLIKKNILVIFEILRKLKKLDELFFSRIESFFNNKDKKNLKKHFELFEK